jgi:hypothetical protein
LRSCQPTLTCAACRTVGFVEVLRKFSLDEIRSEGYAFLMEMKFILHRGT